METRDNIVNELKQIAPTLAAIEKKNFYSVPDGYFVDFKNNIVGQVKLSGVEQELKEVAPALLNLERRPAVEVPIGYFTAFSKGLVQQIRSNEIKEELNVVAPALSAIEKQNTLSVPANYFQSFPQQMLKQIKAAEKAPGASIMPVWLQSLNSALENIATVIFKPKYSVTFAGLTTVLIVAIMFNVKIDQPQPCADFICMADKLTDAELNSYLDNSSVETYQEEVIEAAINDNADDLQVYKEVLQNVSDEELTNAMLD